MRIAVPLLRRRRRTRLAVSPEHEMRKAAAAGEEMTDKVRQRSYCHHLQASTTVVQPTVGTDCRHARDAGVVSLA
ncbi:unnamed protein product [Pylaiella littoralis]